MGNWVGRYKGVHPTEDQARHRTSSSSSSNSLRIKVRMTAKQFKELMAEVDATKIPNSNSELGRLILRECLEGRSCARVVAAAENHEQHARGWKLSTIHDHSS
ncbi:hypothetical protein PRUPE_2G197000 [Prunus persica]|uniref:Uncharacterized protein n=1 Tax=Prunus persica TaxID=3760 RepID=M5X891_PRUPE|nr:hypothetical protein PRUPE_2G197000 [Prunus persica]